MAGLLLMRSTARLGSATALAAWRAGAAMLLAGSIEGQMRQNVARALMIGVALIQGCSAASFQRPKPALDITGKWQGVSVTACGVMLLELARCNARERITFTLFQDGSDISGVYTCAYGTMICQDLNDRGKVVSSSINGSLARLRVEMPDGSSCMFNGTFQTESVVGGFACYQGGGLLEQGSWQAARLF